MRKDIFFQNKRKLWSLIIVILCVTLIYGSFYITKKLYTQKNDKEIEKILSGITYTETNVNYEIGILQKYTDRRNISVKQTGELYKALAELSYMTGDEMLYNRYIATAIFYLEESDDLESVIYLTNKFMGRLYANGCYESGEKMLANMADRYDISGLSYEMQVSFYLTRADMNQMMDRNADEYLDNARDALLLATPGNIKRLNQAKYDLLLTRKYIKNKEWDRAKDIISKYNDSYNFGLGENHVYVICDFKIPYEELMAKISLHDSDITKAEEYLNSYIKLCDHYQFRAMELNLIKYFINQPEILDSVDSDTYSSLENDIMQKNLNELTNEYAGILLADIDNTTENLSMKTANSNRWHKYFLIACIGIITISILIYSLNMVFESFQKDTLTRLYNRRHYEKLRYECDRKKIPYGYLMFDIDDFKKVNDTLGHEKGDVVLSGIAAIILKHTGRGIFAFRYGGEELCMMFIRMSRKKTIEIAETIRKEVEDARIVDDMRVTISGGLCMSLNGENVFVNADKRLYEAKANGKNQIQY